MNRISLFFKALRELGPRSLSLFATYRLGLATGHYRRLTRNPMRIDGLTLASIFPLPSRDELTKVLGKEGQARLMAEADEICEGKVRLFGGEPVPLRLVPEGDLAHWTAYETGKEPFPPSEFNDVKYLWEPARFGWAFILGRAFYLSENPRYAQAFWKYAEQFIDSNPPYLGPQWASGQEVAIRLMALTWAGQMFTPAAESTPERMEKLAGAIAAHAERIPPTMVYARSQNNNHLISEAAGLYTAALAIPGHPRAEAWRGEGWKWLEQAFKKQIYKDGSYVQHSTNYHRLMLQLGLWVWTLANLSPARRGGTPQKVEAQLSLASKWLSVLTDRESGQAVNLGANDGAYIFPLTICPFNDFRPVVQASSLAFAGEKPFRNGPWDEMVLWFGQKAFTVEQYSVAARPVQKFLIQSKNSWAYLRAVKFRSRPSHADQLHVDLWWKGLNIARDAGSYSYNADSPWNNALTSTLVHNTVMVNNREQMTRAGRFLYLDWALAGIIESSEDGKRAVARLQGYKSLGVIHTRKVELVSPDRWRVEDELAVKKSDHQMKEFRLHWLFPNWEWSLDQKDAHFELRLQSPLGWVTIEIASTLPNAKMTLVWAGERLTSDGLLSPILGWYSPSYGHKEPALSVAFDVSGSETAKFVTEFVFPNP